MKYILILSFRAEIYRIEPRVRVYFRDTMLDEFRVPEHKFDDPKKSNIHSYIVEVPKELKETEIKLKILNHDNNWTNGFMTKDTKIMLDEIHFFPEPSMQNLYSFYSKNRRNIHELMYNMKNRIRKTKNQEKENGLFNLMEYVSWNRTEGLHEGEEVKNIKDSKFGGSGYYSVKFYKKYGMLLPKNMKNTRNYWIIRPQFIQKVYDQIAKIYNI